MDAFWSQLLLPPPIIPPTINDVWVTSTARAAIYTVMAAGFVIGTLAHLSRRHPLASALRRGLLAALFAAGLAYALRADLGWTIWVANDLQAFGGRTTEQKLLKMEGSLYDFIRRARTVVTGDYTIHSRDLFMTQRTEYFLLPFRKRTDAATVIVLDDPRTAYDPVRRVLTREGVQREGMAPLLFYAPNAYIVKQQ